MSDVEKDIPGAPNLPFGMTWDNPIVQFTASKDFDPDRGDWPHQISLSTFDFSSGTFPARVEINLPNDDCELFHIGLAPDGIESNDGEHPTREQRIGSLALNLLSETADKKVLAITKLRLKKTSYRALRKISGALAVSSAGATGVLVLNGIVSHSANSFGLAVATAIVAGGSISTFSESGDSYDSVEREIDQKENSNISVLKLIDEIENNGLQIIEPAIENE